MRLFDELAKFIETGKKPNLPKKISQNLLLLEIETAIYNPVGIKVIFVFYPLVKDHIDEGTKYTVHLAILQDKYHEAQNFFETNESIIKCTVAYIRSVLVNLRRQGFQTQIRIKSPESLAVKLWLKPGRYNDIIGVRLISEQENLGLIKNRVYQLINNLSMLVGVQLSIREEIAHRHGFSFTSLETTLDRVGIEFQIYTLDNYYASRRRQANHVVYEVAKRLQIVNPHISIDRRTILLICQKLTPFRKIRKNLRIKNLKLVK